MSMDWISLSFSIDLVAAAQDQLKFLKEINRLGNLYEGHYFHRALYRYETIWLPLMQRYEDTNIVPPIDVQWIWNIHMLSTTNYLKDIQKITDNKIINNRIKDQESLIYYYRYSKDLWESFSGGVPYDYIEDETKQEVKRTKVDYNLKEASLQQKQFLYQISLPHYENTEFLIIGLERYKKFLNLRKAYPSEFFLPCNLISIIWNAHKLHPVEYAKDSMRILGYVFSINDNLANRSTNPKLIAADAATRELWKQLYNESFFQPGAGFRGNFKALSNRIVDLYDLATPYTSFTLVGIYLVSNEQRYGERIMSEFKVSIYRNINSNIEELYSLDVQPMKAYRVLKTEEFPFTENTSKSQYFTIIVEETHNSTNYYNSDFQTKRLKLNTIACIDRPKQEMEIQKHKFDFRDKATLLEYSLILEWKVSVRYNQEIILFLNNDKFKKLNKNESIQLIKPLNELFVSKLDSKSQVFRAKHKLRVPNFDNIYTVEAISANNPTFSALQIHLDNHTVATSKLIGHEQIPDTSFNTSLSLNNQTQRAMLVQHLETDYAILKAEWIGFERASSTKVGKSGFLTIEWHSMGHNENIIKKFNLTNPKRFVISNPSDTIVADVDLSEGVIIVKFNSIAKNLEAFLASVFSIVMLNALVMPKFSKLRRTIDNSGVLITQNNYSTYAFYDAVGYANLLLFDGDNDDLNDNNYE